MQRHSQEEKQNMSEYNRISGKQKTDQEKISALLAHGSRLCAEIEAFKAVSDEIGEFVDTLSSVLSVQDCLQLASSIYDLPISLLKSMIPDTKEN